MKMVVLKPIMWNDKGYTRPAGYPSTSGYSQKHGYGHEEWNNNPNWIWSGFKVFHTEGTGRLVEAAQDGNLGMLMITSHDGVAYGVGVATNVYCSDKTERKIIAKAVGVFDEWKRVWALDTVQACFPNQAAFLTHWKQQYTWIQWKCPPEQYYWFKQPIRLDPKQITGKSRLSMHHGTFTQVTPEILLDVIDGELPKSHIAIRKWLSFGDFEPVETKGTGQAQGSKTRRKLQRKYGNAPTDRQFQYWVEGNRNVEPRHHLLQAKYVAYLRSKGFRPKENQNYIDVQYSAKGGEVLCEVKPTDKIDTRYAIRVAIGQLLEHRYKHNARADLEVVLGTKPRANEVSFVKSLGLRLTYYDSGRDCFVTT